MKTWAQLGHEGGTWDASGRVGGCGLGLGMCGRGGDALMAAGGGDTCEGGQSMCGVTWVYTGGVHWGSLRAQACGAAQPQVACAIGCVDGG